MKITSIALFVSVVAVAHRAKGSRGAVVHRHRLEWVPHRDRLLLEGQFKRYYRMSAEAFDVLVQLLTPTLERVVVQSENRTGTKPIEVVNMIQMTISWLAGGSYHTIRVLAGVSVSAFYNILVEVMNAICVHPRFLIAAPVNDFQAIKAAAEAFSTLSSNHVLTGCIGCIDGWLCQIRAPSAKEVPDVSAFYSGHYLTYGVNVQAMCDASCKFIGYCFNSPGKVSDSVAFSKWPLSADIADLPFGYYVIGDNAYDVGGGTVLLQPSFWRAVHLPLIVAGAGAIGSIVQYEKWKRTRSGATSASLLE